MNSPQSLQTLRAPARTEVANFAPGFGSLESFELMQRAAKLLSSSTLVPVAYRQTIEKLDRFGNVKESRENPNALANAVVALNMSQRMGADPLMVMQNLYIVEGRPSWSSQWIIAAINGCGRFSPLRFDIKVLGAKTIEYKSSYWEDGKRQTRIEKVQINDKICIAWAVERETGERIESPPVTIEMAVLEGWYTKNGSKWQTMDEIMLRYRTASFFGKLYAPELLMGLQTVEEMHDIIDATPGPDGTIRVDVEQLRAEAAAAPAAKSKAKADDSNVTDVQENGTSPDATEEEPAIDLSSEASTIAERLRAADSLDVLDLAAGFIGGVKDEAEHTILSALYEERRDEIDGVVQQAKAAAEVKPARQRRAAAPE